jgi:hypothetical protein
VARELAGDLAISRQRSAISHDAETRKLTAGATKQCWSERNEKSRRNHEILNSHLAGEIPARPKPSRQVESEPCDVEGNDDADA